MKKTIILIGSLIVIIGLLSSASINLAVLKEGTDNDSPARWGKQEQQFAYELCAEAEEEKVKISYRWITDNIEYDPEYDILLYIINQF